MAHYRVARFLLDRTFGDIKVRKSAEPIGQQPSENFTNVLKKIAYEVLS